MTTLLEKALLELQSCSPGDQDAIAALILEQLADDHRWDATFTASLPALEKVADKVRADIRAGRSREMRSEDL